MGVESCAYLINTTPKYFYLLPLHITLLHRYSTVNWPIFIATESKELLPELEGVTIIELPLDKEAFWDSRAEAVRRLPAHIKYVCPVQEDFLLEGRPMKDVIVNAIDILESNQDISSLRLMPCPGPIGTETFLDTRWRLLNYAIDSLVFTYQATIWRRGDYIDFMDVLIQRFPSSQNKMAIKVNFAEIHDGQMILKAFGKKHLAWPREGSHPNAVYLCPWPYRPTAVVRGTLEPWAAELMKREGFMVKLDLGPLTSDL
jgi:hypothetical protein